jgi:SAM-dependent methyltransferase
MSLANTLLGQLRKPTGRLGQLNLWRMNHHHSQLTDWGLEQVAISDEAIILDIGCGGGRTIHKLAGRAVKGKVYGVDHSETSVATSRKANAGWIQMGRVEIVHGSVSRLPFPEQMFDLATAVETHFFWPDLPADLREVFRVLQSEGVLILIVEVYRGGKHDRQVQKLADAMQSVNLKYSNLSVDEHRDLLQQAGFSDIRVIEDYERGWLCVIGKKTSSSTQSEAKRES